MRWIGLFLLSLFILGGCGDKGGNVGIRSENGKPVDFKPGSVTCPQCHMDLKSMIDSAELVRKNGEVVVFDDPGCMVLWMEAHHVDPSHVRLWVYSRDMHRWIDATKAHYSQTDPTPMGYGFGAYEKPAKDRIPFEEMRLRVLRGLTLKDPKIRKKLLGY
ncbi:hypothetical protein [Hydrogenimonas cancrithermarum]|uniref:Uncharacterized protein n=1 Tax=Hydrogenimonas cancrithermarum TaxID=2993563 RepID=A0ABM8FLT2_9BACT|nr:hypothetical protein [Hydrogenimonas cancrithermarum]BDY12422.1 hypothetical protein HCR_07340 [Hydrogenimonas cancrithermarum]